MKFSTALACALTVVPCALAATESFPTIVPTVGPPSRRSISFPLSIFSPSILPSIPLSTGSFSAVSSVSITSPSAPLSTPTAPTSGSSTGSVPAVSGSSISGSSISGSAAPSSSTTPNGARAVGVAGMGVALGAGLVAAALL
ncbi:hypothetical protein B0H16DRAFT_1488250 [Mycena metata]|uniref:Uncharacterized protein n=1 Tax=Mycena metata TaxID=1033252 RepID=A0AAD7P352_9AGAR|nr:hypothetical protein B0H16DRAFT_1488250 [Mycena metata]